MLILIGGEIFKDKERLWKYLESVKEENSRNDLELLLQTNGFWINRDKKEMRSIFSKLKNLMYLI